MNQQNFDTAIKLIDAANSEDPNLETSDDKNWPKELLYSHRMSDMQQRYYPDADDAVKLSVRAQHIQRWKSPRDNYPMDRKGYHQWRTALYGFHADTVAALLLTAGYDETFIERVKLAVGKKSLKTSHDSQMVEDIATLVFIEYYMQGFVDRHPEYDEEKWLGIIRRTWDKMTGAAHQFVLAGNIALPASLTPLIQKAIKD